MPIFEIEKDGATYQVDAPDHAAAASAFGAMKFQPPSAKELATDAGAAGAFQVGLARGFPGAVKFGSMLDYYLGMGQGKDAKSYDETLQRNQAMIAEMDKQHPIAGVAGNVAGGLALGGGLAKAGLSLTAKAAQAGKGLVTTAGASAVDGAALGGLAGAAEANSLSEAPWQVGKGAGLGLLLGGSAPFALAGASKVASPVINAVSAWRDPATAASRAVMERMRSAGVTPQMAQQQLSEAAADGQGMFTLADAMGHAGGRALTPVTRTPNDARQMVVDFIMGRQAGQGGRVASHLQEASGSSLTAAQNKSLMEASRASAAERNYAPVKADKTAIDVSEPIDVANRAISPMASAIGDAQGWQPTNLAARSGIEAGEGAIRDPIRSAMKEARAYLAADNLTVANVEKAFRAKTNIDQMIATAADKKQGALVSELLPMQKALDDALARTSSQYAFARDSYKAASQPIDAIDVGRGLFAPRVRSEDALNTFGALPNKATQDAARIGYFDPLVSRAEGTAGTMTNSARPLSSDKYKTELPQFAAPGKGDQLTRRLDREQKMFETNSSALGGSRTADNLADAADSAMLDTSVLGNLLSGNFKGAGLQLALKAGNKFAGRSPAVLDNMGKMLTNTDPSSIGKMLALAQMQQQASDRVRAEITAMLMGVGVPGATRLLP